MKEGFFAFFAESAYFRDVGVNIILMFSHKVIILITSNLDFDLPVLNICSVKKKEKEVRFEF